MSSWIRLVALLSFLGMISPVQAQSPDEGAPGAKPSVGSNLVSANGFTCTQVGSGVNCKGTFKDLDKGIVFSASGEQSVQLTATKKDKVYSYSSKTGCLCEQNKSSKKCTNQGGKTKTFKGDTMVQDSASFCTGGKEK